MALGLKPLYPGTATLPVPWSSRSTLACHYSARFHGSSVFPVLLFLPGFLSFHLCVSCQGGCGIPGCLIPGVLVWKDVSDAWWPSAKD